MRAVGVVALLVMVGALLRETVEPGLSWSPYYKVSVKEARRSDGERALILNVNGIPHQNGVSPRVAEEFGIYAAPYRVAGRHLDDVLVIGAGTGTDVGIALRNGVRHVDAVEIDPRIQQIGRERQPGLPYDDPRVEPHVEDGRAYLERTDRDYDLIVLALPDSLTLVAGQSSLRLENYLFTFEALDEARRHLKPGGIFSMYNVYRERWLVDRLALTLTEVYGHPPCIFSPEGGAAVAVLTTSADASAVRNCSAVWEPQPETPAPVRDDHPFLYLKERTIPGVYLLTLALILAASILAVRAFGGPLRAMSPYLDLFLMGASFLLLETKNVVQFALLFGTTWLVNAMVFTGILGAVLLAVMVARRSRLPAPGVLYAGLFGSLAIALALPQRLLLQLSFAPRLLAAIALAFAPVFLANLIFAQRFREVGSATSAFGANLLGAMVGGVIEYASLITGYRALLVLVAVLYAAALVSGRRATVRAA